MDPLSVLILAHQCVAAAPPSLVAAMALAQTGASPYAVTITGETKSPADLDSAVQAAALALTDGALVRIGIANVPVSKFQDRGLSYGEGFSACTNLAVAGELLSESWQRFGSMEEHWRLAVLDYATGQAGTEGAFARKFDAALTKIEAAAWNLPADQTSTDVSASAQPQDKAVSRVEPRRRQVGAGWDVFSRDRSRSLLVYSK